VTIVLLCSNVSGPARADGVPDWLAAMNAYRAQAKLPPVTEDPAFSQDDLAHARYSVKNHVLQHSEDPGSPWYSAEGDRAAHSSNGAQASSGRDAIEQWMQAPFHALGILDPRLKTTGFGLYSDHDGSSAWLNVIGGLGALPAGTQFPIFWPGDHTATSLLSHWGETPEPSHSCPGYPTKTGLPLLVQLQPGMSPDVADSSLLEGTVPVEHCILTAQNFHYEDPAWQSAGRSILAARNAIVILPRDPLEKNKIYYALVKIGSHSAAVTYSWSFATH
jgi:hypothetical protein